MKKTTMAAVTAVSVAGALAVGLGAVSSWFTNWNVKTWFGRGGDNAVIQPEKPNTPDSPISSGDTKDGAIISDGENNGISLMSAKLPIAAYAANGVSEQADTAYTVTAIFDPATATNQSVDWSVSWVNADSAWASGKSVTDYVTVSTATDGASTAIVECKQAFGEQIVLTCTSRYNTSLSATCMVDYTEKIIGAQLRLGNYFGGGPYNDFDENSGVVTIDWVCCTPSDPSGMFSVDNSTIKKSLCTITDTYEWNIVCRPTAEFLGYLPMSTAGSFSYTVYKDNKYINNSEGFDLYKLNQLYGVNVCKTSQFYNALGVDEIKNTYGCMTIESTITGKYSSYTYTYKAVFNQANAAVPVDNVSLDTPSIVF